ncbi:hypothetical protein DPMN_128710 [Dreissena polymorpha]|uniref:Uncharacterized protein n=1 Tax=Dreissena polymorpha TaxID=45954 RepID=A0A9D4H3M9_DREPO|nr:hypothetical protein DPMN_128710 [Dreissena polymorpha]
MWKDHTRGIILWKDHTLILWKDHTLILWKDHTLILWKDHTLILWKDHTHGNDDDDNDDVIEAHEDNVHDNETIEKEKVQAFSDVAIPPNTLTFYKPLRLHHRNLENLCQRKVDFF